MLSDGLKDRKPYRVRLLSDPEFVKLYADDQMTEEGPDFFRDKAYPTYLCYNPYAEQRSHRLAVGHEPVDLYDAVTHRFVDRDVCSPVDVTLPADSAAVIVAAPAGGKLTREGRRTLVDGVVVDWRWDD